MEGFFKLIENVEFWKAIAAMLWPIVVLVVFISARTKIYTFLNRDNLSIKVAGMELSVTDATKSLGESVSDLQKRLAAVETAVSTHTLDLTRALLPNKTGSPDSVDKDSRPPQSKEFGSRKLSILWVDDYPSNNAFQIDQFRKDGLDVQLALSTDEALKALENEKFDLIITDLGRRENGISNAFAGMALIKAVRNFDSMTPILVYAGLRGIQNREKLVKAGATSVSESAVELQRVVAELQKDGDLRNIRRLTS